VREYGNLKCIQLRCSSFVPNERHELKESTGTRSAQSDRCVTSIACERGYTGSGISNHLPSHVSYVMCHVLNASNVVASEKHVQGEREREREGGRRIELRDRGRGSDRGFVNAGRLFLVKAGDGKHGLARRH